MTSIPAPLSAHPTVPPNTTPFITSAPPPIMDIPPLEDPLLQFMTNSIMRHGKRKRASRTISRMLLWVHSLTRAPPLEIVREAVLLAAPAVRTMSHTHGGKIVSRPVALSEKQRTRYAVKWIIKACDNRAGQTLEERLAREIIATVQRTSSVLVEKERVHTFAMVNRYAFTGYTFRSMPELILLQRERGVACLRKLPFRQLALISIEIGLGLAMRAKHISLLLVLGFATVMASLSCRQTRPLGNF